MAFFAPADRSRLSQQSSPSHSITNLINARDSSAFSSHNSLHPYDIPPLSGSNSPIVAPSISDKYSLAPDPTAWGSNLSPEFAELDDELHNPDPRRDRGNDHAANIFTYRGLTNLGCLVILCLGLLMLFAGYPLVSHFTARPGSTLGGFNLGGINATGQVPTMSGNWGLIDNDTPQSAYETYSYTNPSNKMQLIFSDEFNLDGRTFYPGDDPYWEASDFHYWSTNNLEWCDPAAITTANGSLVISLSQKETHGMDYEGGHMTTWNKFCFTGGIIEASVQLPGASNVMGLWPAVWAMGNLGRAGYGASLEGMWPYSYDACDVGTVANQTVNGLPLAATTNGDTTTDSALSFLPGQRLSRCTCKGESHPGPMHSDGTYVGRAAPEIDVFEAQVSGPPYVGHVSQSAQWAPFNPEYLWFNTSDTYSITNSTATQLNSYHGGSTQQTTSAVTITNQSCYELSGACFSVYGFEYKPGFDDGYITWVSDNKVAWTVKSSGLAADTRVEISARPIPMEPMYLIVNLGLSENFGTIDLDHLVFPAHLLVDWIRVYQDPDSINIGCDPPDFPTTAYINEYIEAYSNPNLTTWVDDYKQTVPKNSFLGQC